MGEGANRKIVRHQAANESSSHSSTSFKVKKKDGQFAQKSSQTFSSIIVKKHEKDRRKSESNDIRSWFISAPCVKISQSDQNCSKRQTKSEEGPLIRTEVKSDHQ